ncbi:GAF domain-containing sensor histidine kinase [Candidatus Dojkabacteria bacterium]|uniref:histidine kinase n=1 Tax=Candidatus Dojkabacteria bacterium TaxID=2099670 RepID=A0A955I8H1_9BACT|nr:GAF domain-containing sensor histidine kinase [Candidatus Dojkabacteria bacterium]
MIYSVSTIISILIILIVLYGNKSKTTIYFSLVLSSILGWVLTLYFFYNIDIYHVVLALGKINFAFVVVLSPMLYLFIKNYPKERDYEKIDKFALFQTLILVLLTIFTRLIVMDEIIAGNDRITVYGPGISVFIIHFLIYVILSFRLLKIKIKQSEGAERKQLYILIISIISSVIFGFTTNLVIPLIYTNNKEFISLNIYTQIQNLGPLASLIFGIPLGYSIIKYRFLNSRLIFGKIFYYALIAFPPYFMYFLLALIYETNFGTSLNKYAYFLGIPVAIMFTIFLNSFNKFISEYTDSHLINPGYNPLVALEQLRERISNSLDIEKISQESLFMIARTIRPESSGVIIMTNTQTYDILSFNYKKEPYKSTQDFGTFLQFFISRNIKTITANDLRSSQQYNSSDNMLKSHILKQMSKYELEVILPLKEEQKVRGLLLVGYKEAKAPYNPQELKLLSSIAETMSLGIGRALLYKEIQQFNETLQKKVTNATTELQTKNKALEEALLKLEEVRRQEKDMLDVMGHELRTPISIARNSVVTLQKHIGKNDTDPEKLTKYTKMAVESIRREIALIETFLSTTKLEGGRMQVNTEKVSLKEVVHESLEGHNELSKRNNTKVIFNEPENDIFVIADKIRIQEVMDNFLNNAIKYTGEGNVEIKIYEAEGLGWVDVKDDGIGISAENLQKLGRKFFRAQTLYNQSNNVVNPSGTGLGLFVSFQLIDLMKGKRKITSQEGAGSTFSFGLPLDIS